MSTQKAWNRDEFFAWLEGRPGAPGAMSAAKIAHVGQLAEAAGIHPSTLSRWRSGSRPTQDKLTAIAKVLRVPRREIFLIAGLLDESDLDPAVSTLVPSAYHGALRRPSGSPPQDGTELTAEERQAIAMIEASNLSEPLKKRLIADHLEESRRAREERQRQLRSKIDLLETT